MSTNYRITDQSRPHFLTLTLVEWVDLFTREKYKEIIMDSLRFCIEEKGLVLYAYVIMSNHVHLIVRSKNEELSSTIRDLKRYTSKMIFEQLSKDSNESRKNWLLWIFKSQGAKSNSNRNFKVWQHENHPVILDSNSIQDQKLNYIHLNPVRAGICRSPEDYVYSSADAYAGGTPTIPIEFIQ
ncbi:REP-associated tyrosine transposase [Reichenbachiella ulvae]|uniref:Transposase n=1 Tax=Reichenbachiella ulvae TaxID=2980104 RepID=A0ABT3CU63_9BACT|nr:transposase [Reichenbachiella ulvae]MCV9387121.1 transposase [Reichenbachiella ulvae]